MTKILDWNKYIETARQVNSEGCVLLENKNNALPLADGTKAAVFGRIQSSYYKSGTGSGGMVNVTKVWGIVDGLKESKKVIIDPTVEKAYADWEKENPFEKGNGWGQEPWSQKEMELDDGFVKAAAERNDCAIVIIGRTAGEDKDNFNGEGSWLLTSLERKMLSTVKKYFKKTIVILNVGNIIDMNFVKEYDLDAVLYSWQGGITGGLGVADIITGKVSPSGKLSDTIAKDINDYPASKCFGDLNETIYKEDIFVGYRYFETFAKDKVLYPFGSGLSYSTFDFNVSGFSVTLNKIPEVKFYSTVKNTGNFNAKETIFAFVKASQGKLGKPALTLIDFKKTKELKPGKKEKLSFCIDLTRAASFDDTGCTGHKGAFVLEEGKYEIFAGTDIRNIISAGFFEIEKTIVTEKVTEALLPVKEFSRLKAKEENGKIIAVEEKVKPVLPYQNIHREKEKNEIKDFTKQKGLDKKIVKLLEKLSDEDLSVIIRGEGMGSPKVTPGTAAAFGGVSKSLNEKGIPCGCCTDGPSGLRLDSGAQAFSMPNGTLQACSFNPDLIYELYKYEGLEMLYNKVDVILGPGINIHRYPLNGRNFEYFSEDPLVTGIFAAAIVKGLAYSGVSGSLKHFACNNQEAGRRTNNAVVSERALREIYLKAFEIPVKNGADVIMTSYGSVNGLWTSGNFDLNTLILRKDWHFNGIVMSDWWAVANDEGKEPVKANTAQMIRAQNDLYMVVQSAEENEHGDNTIQELKNANIDRNELLRNAYNIISFIRKSPAQKRFEGKKTDVKIINRESTPMDEYAKEIVYYDLVDELVIPLDKVDTSRGKSFGFGVTCKTPDNFDFTITGSTGDNEVEQVNVSLSFNGVHVYTFTWNGTHGKDESKSIPFTRRQYRYVVFSLFFAQSGLKAKEIRITRSKK